MAVDGKAQMATALLKRMGLDPEAYKGMIEEFIEGMRRAVEQINSNQQRIETMLKDLQVETNSLSHQVRGSLSKLETIEMKLHHGLSLGGTTTPIYANGEHTGVLITDEKFPQEILDDVNHRGEGNP
jgi:hypothetical protein